MSKKSWLAIGSVAIAALVGWLAYAPFESPGELPAETSTSQSLGPPNSNSTGPRLESANKDDGPIQDPHWISDLPVMDARHRETRREFDDMVAGAEDIADYILRHVTFAQNGDADSAVYVAEAMRYCVLALGALDLSVDHYDVDSKNRTEVEEAILARLVDIPVFHRNEARNHIRRGFACRDLGYQHEEYSAMADDWEAFANDHGQTLAVARAANSKVKSDASTKESDAAKASIREVLSRSREMRVLRYAGAIVARSTGRNVETERLAWSLLACEYDSCDSLNYFYRGMCDMLLQQGVHLCTAETTDAEFLFRRYPALFDAARARSLEIKHALDSEQWEFVGLN